MTFKTEDDLHIRDKPGVFGSNDGAPNSTGVRGYIHVAGIAKGHVKAIQKTAQGGGITAR